MSDMSVLDVTPYAKHLRRCATSAATVTSDHDARSGAAHSCAHLVAAARYLLALESSGNAPPLVPSARRSSDATTALPAAACAAAVTVPAGERLTNAPIAPSAWRDTSRDASPTRANVAGKSASTSAGGAWLPPSWRTCARVFRASLTLAVDAFGSARRAR